MTISHLLEDFGSAVPQAPTTPEDQEGAGLHGATIVAYPPLESNVRFWPKADVQDRSMTGDG